MNLSRQMLTRQAIVAALYAVLTWAIPALSYGPVQFRLSEVMTLLAFFNPQYVIGLTVGCAISNIISSLGMIDIVVGTFATFCAVTAMTKFKNIDRKSTRLNSSHANISYAVFCLKKTKSALPTD